MRAAEIRKKFLEFFRERDHEMVPSSPVVPLDDPTLLFANAGMNQFKSVFTGAETRDYVRAASTQKCIRAGGKHNDLENVGYTARHLTFFEMLGNFSFGDYFKSDACRWAWELVTEGFGIDKKDLWITVYHEDDEARAVWRDEVGIADDRIVGLGAADNYWSMGDVGPCGPCSEIFFDRGDAAACGPKCALGVCDCDRYMEIWNLVFMQFEKHPDGTQTALPKPSIDTGMGLERISMVLQQKESVFDTDALAAIMNEIATITGRPYDTGDAGTPHRVIADHVRSLTFAIADGAYPSNEGRGYVLRRILRRAARYGYKLGMEEAFIYRLVEFLGREMGEAFPELIERQEVIAKLIRSEEEQFGRTLNQGMTRFGDVSDRLGKGEAFPAAEAFFLHDTCGFPIDLTEQMCREQGLDVDKAGYETLMAQQKERSRKSTSATTESAGATVVKISTTEPTVFTGYQEFQGNGQVREVLATPGRFQIVLDATPFYAESGGQVGDTGTIASGDFRLRVTGTKKQDGVFVHDCELDGGDPEAVRADVTVETAVDAERRLAIHRNHTATHLVHAALRDVLGDHVQQKGSLVAPDRLRFDVSHFEKVSADELREVERRVQEQILQDTAIEVTECDKDEALARGAMAFFGEKYGDKVRVVQIGDYSLELCGGAHCARTGEIGGFLFVHEGSVSSGVRRVEALTGTGTLERVRDAEDILRDVCGSLKTDRDALGERIEGLLQEIKDLKTANKKSAQKDLLAEIDGGAGDRWSEGGREVIAASWEGADMDEILRVADALKRRDGERVFVLASYDDGGVRFLVGSSAAVKKGQVHCGNIARDGAKTLGGGGGGRPDMAQAGGKDVAKLAEAMQLMRDAAAQQLGS
ncbi:MAG: alanine--tRNA ligase [Planctomycetota bacterium]